MSDPILRLKQEGLDRLGQRSALPGLAVDGSTVYISSSPNGAPVVDYLLPEAFSAKFPYLGTRLTTSRGRHLLLGVSRLAGCTVDVLAEIIEQLLLLRHATSGDIFLRLDELHGPHDIYDVFCGTAPQVIELRKHIFNIPVSCSGGPDGYWWIWHD